MRPTPCWSWRRKPIRDRDATTLERSLSLLSILLCAGFLAQAGEFRSDEGESSTGYTDRLNPRSSESFLPRLSPALTNRSKADYILPTGIDEPVADPTQCDRGKKIFQVTNRETKCVTYPRAQR
jgi:hypothetical protein